MASQTFKDTQDREWKIVLDAPTIREIRSEFNGLDLIGVDGAAFEKLSDDPLLLVDVFWVLCREQAEARQISDRDFGRAMKGDVIDKATEALLEGVKDFFQNAKRKLFTATAAKNKAFREQAINQVMQTLESPDLQERVIGKIKEQLDEDLERILTQSFSVTSTPEPLASRQEV